jgi:hypothetical protein
MMLSEVASYGLNVYADCSTICTEQHMGCCPAAATTRMA